MNDRKAFIWGFVIGSIIVAGIIISAIGLSTQIEFKNDKMFAFDKYTNNSIKGVYFKYNTICVALNGDTERELNTLKHEYVHHLLIQDKNCGLEKCREHFCGDFYDR